MSSLAECLQPAKREHYHFCLKSPVSKFMTGSRIMTYAPRTTRVYQSFGGPLAKTIAT